MCCIVTATLTAIQNYLPMTLTHKSVICLQVKRVGPENVNWETFIYELHPMRDPVRLELIKDDSPYQKEATRKEAGEEDEAKYTPDVFKLTENGSSTPTS